MPESSTRLQVADHGDRLVAFSCWTAVRRMMCHRSWVCIASHSEMDALNRPLTVKEVSDQLLVIMALFDDTSLSPISILAIVRN